MESENPRGEGAPFLSEQDKRHLERLEEQVRELEKLERETEEKLLKETEKLEALLEEVKKAPKPARQRFETEINTMLADLNATWGETIDEWRAERQECERRILHLKQGKGSWLPGEEKEKEADEAFTEAVAQHIYQETAEYLPMELRAWGTLDHTAKLRTLAETIRKVEREIAYAQEGKDKYRWSFSLQQCLLALKAEYDYLKRIESLQMYVSESDLLHRVTSPIDQLIVATWFVIKDESAMNLDEVWNGVADRLKEAGISGESGSQIGKQVRTYLKGKYGLERSLNFRILKTNVNKEMDRIKRGK